MTWVLRKFIWEAVLQPQHTRYKDIVSGNSTNPDTNRIEAESIFKCFISHSYI